MLNLWIVKLNSRTYLGRWIKNTAEGAGTYDGFVTLTDEPKEAFMFSNYDAAEDKAERYGGVVQQLAALVPVEEVDD